VSVRAQDGVLLLHAKPGMLVRHHRHDLAACDAKVGFWKKKRFSDLTDTSAVKSSQIQ